VLQPIAEGDAQARIRRPHQYLGRLVDGLAIEVHHATVEARPSPWLMRSAQTAEYTWQQEAENHPDGSLSTPFRSPDSGLMSRLPLLRPLGIS
jgi:hypothetical protein